MSKLTTLEKDVLGAIFSSHIPEEGANVIVEKLQVKSRVFSSLENGMCSGFYTNFENNSALAYFDEIPSEFSVQAKCDQLSIGEMGFFVFCEARTKSIVVIEGFFYGDDRLSVDELLKEEHSLLVYTTAGL